MKTYDVILFDLDGTLTDSKIGITKGVKYALEHYNINVNDLDELDKFVGPPLMAAFEEFYSFDLIKAKEAVRYYREYYAEQGIFENEVYNGIPKLLEELKNKGKVLAVSTSKPTIFAERILEHFNLKDYFSLIVGSNLDGTRVNKDEVIKYTLENLKVTELERVVMIGDRKHDIIGAAKNNIDSIAVMYGYGSYEEFENSKPTYVAITMEDIFKICD